MIQLIRIPIIRGQLNGIYLRWYYNGWHYYYFQNKREVMMSTNSLDTQITQVFSVISRIERATKITASYSYAVALENISEGDLDGFAGLLIAEKVEQYDEGVWYEVDITRESVPIRTEGAPCYSLEFEITRKELPSTPAVYQKRQLFYIGDTLCDIDDDEIIAVNKQVNDIGEMKDRKTDSTATFKIRKSRAMRALFELTGEVGANTDFPYLKQTCRYIQDGIEIITNGRVVVERSDEQYYTVSAYSGNKDFFTLLEDKKINDLSLPSCDHTWDAQTQATSNLSDLDYIYPGVEPSDDSGIIPLTDTGSRAEVYGGWVWPFVKMKAILDEIISNSGYKAEGAIFENEKFLSMFMPIANREISAVDRWLFSGTDNAWKTYPGGAYDFYFGFHWSQDIVGANDPAWVNDILLVRLSGKYTIELQVLEKLQEGYQATGAKMSILSGTAYVDFAEVTDYTIMQNPTGEQVILKKFTFEEDLSFGQQFRFQIKATHLGSILKWRWIGICWSIQITKIESPKITYGSTFDSTAGTSIANNLPDMKQTDFIKLICNMFALIPEADSRNRKILFWNYQTLYDNIPTARDWSEYLSESDDDVEFKFGNYAQRNYMKFKESQDVLENNGMGVLGVLDETLEASRDAFTLPVCYSDEIIVLSDVLVNRIGFNKYSAKDSAYESNTKIDPRVVIMKEATGKTFGFRTLVGGGTSYDALNCKVSTTLDISFPALINNYVGLSRMLHRTNLRKAKFNLPAYEVAGFKHYIPVYLRQYKAYFYVNKISNYVVGKLCTVELIKL